MSTRFSSLLPFLSDVCILRRLFFLALMIYNINIVFFGIHSLLDLIIVYFLLL